MTLVELLVALVIGLAVTFVVSTLLVAGENHKRTTTSTNDAAVTIDVLANDIAPDGTLNPASIAITTGPAHGTAAVNAGKVLYTPTSGFAGTATPCLAIDASLGYCGH